MFNNYIGLAVVFEYHGGQYEIIRMNMRFADVMELGVSLDKIPDCDMLKLWPEDKPRLKKAVLEVIYSCKDVKTNICRVKNDGTKQQLHLTLRVIAKSYDRALIFGALDA